MTLNRIQDSMFDNSTSLSTNSKSVKGAINEVNASLAETMPLVGVNTGSLQTTYDNNGNLTQTKEFDSSNNLLNQTDITYNSDGTINTITETFNGKKHVTTLNYVNGSLSTTNPFTRSVI